MLYVSMLQLYSARSVLNVRTAPGIDIGEVLQRAIRELDPRVPFYNVGLLSNQTKAATFQQQLVADLLVVFGALALLLAGVGSYGVLSFLVGLRRREIGVRIAVGATRGDVFRLIATSGARVIGTGIFVGLLLSAGVGVGLQSLLIGVSPADPITYGCGHRHARGGGGDGVPDAGAASGGRRSRHDTPRRVRGDIKEPEKKQLCSSVLLLK